jgi:bacterioferritin-associated ferredoxin
MIVCSCNVLTDTAIRAALDQAQPAPRRVLDVYRRLGCGPKCGCCAPGILRLMREAEAAARDEAQAIPETAAA